MASKDNYDPGWNDPPIFSYDKAASIQAAASSRKGTSLNKRVAFPISGNVINKETTDQNLHQNLTKPPSVSQPPSKHKDAKSEAFPQPEVEVLIKDKLHKVLQNLQVKTNCDEDMIKRIRIMEKMWIDDQLDINVQSKIYELSEALADNDPERADHIQKALMVDYACQCSSWMSGIRHLINKKRFQEN